MPEAQHGKRKYRLLPARAVRPVRPDPDAVARARFGRSRRELIAEAAYYRALHGGADPIDDWFAAEREIDGLLSADRILREGSS